MRNSISYRSGLIAVALLALPAACSAPPDPAREDLADTSAVTPAKSATAEDARIQEILADRYLPSDVKHSFRAKWGAEIDCVDFFAQPGARALAAAGHPLTEIPKPPTRPRRIGPPVAHPKLDPSEDYTFRGEPDESGRARSCPEGTVPQIHMDEATLAQNGVVAGVPRGLKRGPPPGPGLDAPGYSHAVGTLSSPNIVVGASTLSIFAPGVSSYYDHSLSQTWTYTGGTIAMSGPCTSGCDQTAEVGWVVSPWVNGGDGSNAYLFTFSTGDGYWNTGCYDNESWLSTGYGPSPHCLPWIQLNQQHLPGAKLPAGVAGNASAQHELAVMTMNDGVGWYVFATLDDDYADWGEALGYYPSWNYSGTMAGSAATFQAGGEVEQQSEAWTVGMGSGVLPTAGYGKAAYHRNVYIGVNVAPDGADIDGPGNLADTSAGGSSDPYTYATSPAPGPGWSGGYFYFGGENLPLIHIQPGL